MLPHQIKYLLMLLVLVTFVLLFVTRRSGNGYGDEHDCLRIKKKVEPISYSLDYVTEPRKEMMIDGEKGGKDISWHLGMQPGCQVIGYDVLKWLREGRPSRPV